LNLKNTSDGYQPMSIYILYTQNEKLILLTLLDKILKKCITVPCNVQEGAGFSVKQKQPRGQKLQIGKFIRTCAIFFPNCHPAQALKLKVPITVVTAKVLLMYLHQKLV
jgi:hypothetical protein